MKRQLMLCLVLASTLSTTGCPGGGTKPAVPSIITNRIANYELKTFDQDLAAYEAAVGSGQTNQARIIRDEVVHRLKRVIDKNYFDFESQLFNRRATSNVLFDITELGAAAATNITNGERAKNIIAVALTAFKGGRKSIDDNFFRQQTIEIIITKMQASRARIATSMTQKLTNLPPENYSLDEALGDLIEYFYAGSLQRALQEVSQDVGQDATEAKAQARQLDEIRVASEIEFDKSKQIRQKITQLAQDIKSKDQTRQSAARAAVNQALSKLGVALPDTATDDERIRALVKKSAEANKAANREQAEDALIQALGIQ